MLDHELERLRAQAKEFLAAALDEARRSADPVRAELAREIQEGRLTAAGALANPAYRELLEPRLHRVVHARGSTEDPERPAETRAEPVVRPVADDEDFSDRTILRRP